jgi:hypothetical protein
MAEPFAFGEGAGCASALNRAVWRQAGQKIAQIRGDLASGNRLSEEAYRCGNSEP